MRYTVGVVDEAGAPANKPFWSQQPTGNTGVTAADDDTGRQGDGDRPITGPIPPRNSDTPWQDPTNVTVREKVV